MNRKAERKVSWRGIFWFVLLPGIIFAVAALARYYRNPDSLKFALLFAVVAAVVSTLAIALVVASIRPLFKWRSHRWLLLGLVCIAILTPLLPQPEHGWADTSIWSMVLPAIGRAALVVIIFALMTLAMRWLLRRRNLRWSLPMLAAIVLLIVGFYVVENWRGKLAWEKYKREWEVRGEKFDLVSLAPPPVPDEKNFALTPIVASCYRDRLAGNRPADGDGPANTNNRLYMILERSGPEAYEYYPTNVGNWQRGITTDLAAWQRYYRTTAVTNLDSFEETNVVALSPDFPIASSPQTPAADVLLALSKYDAAIKELRTASRLPYARIPLDYAATNPSLMLLPHLQCFKQVSLVLRLRAIAEVQSGQADAALEDVRLAVRLMDVLQDEPVTISQLVRIAILQLTLQPVWEGLAGHRWSDAQLVELEAMLAKLDFISNYALAMRGEVASATTTIDYWRVNRSDKDSIAGIFVYIICNDFSAFLEHNIPEWVGDFLSPLFPEKFVGPAIQRLPPDGWFYQNNVALAKVIRENGMAYFDQKQRIVPAGVTTNLDQTTQRFRETYLGPYTILAWHLLPALTLSAGRFAHAQASVDMARVACALERYRLANGNHPETLDALAPRFIDQVTHDIIHGSPLKYRRTSDGQFMLYSIGWNEVDDYGKLGFDRHRVELKKGDWIWWSSSSEAKPVSQADD